MPTSSLEYTASLHRRVSTASDDSDDECSCNYVTCMVILKIYADNSRFLLTQIGGWVLANFFVELVKHFHSQKRPNGEDNQSFPRGHALWGMALMMSFVVTQRHQAFRQWQDNFPQTKKMLQGLAVLSNMLMMVGRILANKHWTGNVIAGSYVALAVSQITDNIMLMLYPASAHNSFDEIYFTDILATSYFIAALLVSNPFEAAYASLGCLAFVGTLTAGLAHKRMTKASWQHGDYFPSETLCFGVISKSPFAYFYSDKKTDMQKIHLVSAATVAVGFCILNALNMPFSMRAGTHTDFEMSWHNRPHGDYYEHEVDVATWALAACAFIGGAGVGFWVDRQEVEADYALLPGVT